MWLKPFVTSRYYATVHDASGRSLECRTKTNLAQCRSNHYLFDIEKPLIG